MLAAQPGFAADYQPISDMRAEAAYRLRAAENLLMRLPGSRPAAGSGSARPEGWRMTIHKSLPRMTAVRLHCGRGALCRRRALAASGTVHLAFGTPRRGAGAASAQSMSPRCGRRPV